MKLTDYVTLGGSGLRVSPYCLGTMTFGTDWGWGAEEAEAIQVLERYMELGGNFLDTANCYTNGHSEVILGNYFGKNPFKRDRMVIATKGFGNMYSGDPNGGGTNFKSLINACDESLRRLQTDYIDLGMIHYVDSEKEWKQLQHSEFLDYVMDLKNRGVIRHIGISSHNPKIAVKAAESGYVEMILFSINPAFDLLPASEDLDTMFVEEFDAGLKGTDDDRARLYRVCEQNDIGITVMKGFAGGRLFDAKRSPFGVRLTPVQCIHYALTRPAVSAIMCGYDTKEQVDQAVAYEHASEAEKDYASVLSNAPFQSYRGECTYCGHCKPCVAELDIAISINFMILRPCSRRYRPRYGPTMNL